eukprot:TRINITY_DN414_c0_g1_i2.p1 TRINITY_DN414_c0_g1~~TRINITY_DN414_c0_g1_i2.p1  ORF type:complete len:1634 (-),score=385.98 TRINITY_DN414_c0_g1_i2:134-5035(-)
METTTHHLRLSAQSKSEGAEVKRLLKVKLLREKLKKGGMAQALLLLLLHDVDREAQCGTLLSSKDSPASTTSGSKKRKHTKGGGSSSSRSARGGGEKLDGVTFLFQEFFPEARNDEVPHLSFRGRLMIDETPFIDTNGIFFFTMMNVYIRAPQPDNPVIRIIPYADIDTCEVGADSKMLMFVDDTCYTFVTGVSVDRVQIASFIKNRINNLPLLAALKEKKKKSDVTPRDLSSKAKSTPREKKMAHLKVKFPVEFSDLKKAELLYAWPVGSIKGGQMKGEKGALFVTTKHLCIMCGKHKASYKLEDISEVACDDSRLTFTWEDKSYRFKSFSTTSPEAVYDALAVLMELPQRKVVARSRSGAQTHRGRVSSAVQLTMAEEIARGNGSDSISRGNRSSSTPNARSPRKQKVAGFRANFNAAFPDLAEERLVRVFNCVIKGAAHKGKGTVFITNEHCCFQYGKKGKESFSLSELGNPLTKGDSIILPIVSDEPHTLKYFNGFAPHVIMKEITVILGKYNTMKLERERDSDMSNSSSWIKAETNSLPAERPQSPAKTRLTSGSRRPLEKRDSFTSLAQRTPVSRFGSGDLSPLRRATIDGGVGGSSQLSKSSPHSNRPARSHRTASSSRSERGTSRDRGVGKGGPLSPLSGSKGMDRSSPFETFKLDFPDIQNLPDGDRLLRTYACGNLKCDNLKMKGKGLVYITRLRICIISVKSGERAVFPFGDLVNYDVVDKSLEIRISSSIFTLKNFSNSSAESTYIEITKLLSKFRLRMQSLAEKELEVEREIALVASGGEGDADDNGEELKESGGSRASSTASPLRIRNAIHNAGIKHLHQIVARAQGPNGVEIKTRSYLMKSYKNCFIGKQFVDWLVSSGEASNRHAALEIGNELLLNSLLTHVSGDHDFKDDKLFFRFVGEFGPSSFESALSAPEIEDIPSAMKSSGVLGGSATTSSEEGASTLPPPPPAITTTSTYSSSSSSSSSTSTSSVSSEEEDESDSLSPPVPVLDLKKGHTRSSSSGTLSTASVSRHSVVRSLSDDDGVLLSSEGEVASPGVKLVQVDFGTMNQVDLKQFRSMLSSHRVRISSVSDCEALITLLKQHATCQLVVDLRDELQNIFKGFPAKPETDFVPPVLKEGGIPYNTWKTTPKTTKFLKGTKLGKKLVERGWKADKPILIVPGLLSTQLKVIESPYPDWVGKRLWINLKLMMVQKMKGKVSSMDEELYSKWSSHIRLDPDSKDPPGVKVRPVSGKEGISSLDPSPAVNGATAYFGPMIENLEALGYDETTLLCKGYDWRISLAALEERDGYLTDLKVSIAECVRRTKKKIVLVGHSLSAMVFQYFFSWLGEEARPFCDTFVDSLIQCAGPWLGAPKTVRGGLVGVYFGMKMFLHKDWGRLLRTFEGLRVLIPSVDMVSCWDYFPRTYFRGDDKRYRRVDYEKLCLHFHPHTLTRVLHAQRRDPHFHNDNQNLQPFLRAPPVKILHNIVAVNLQSEMGSFYVEEKGEVVLDKKAKEFNIGRPGMVVHKGIIYETPEIDRGMVDGEGNKLRRSGDGTIPFESLIFPRYWQNEIPDMRWTEIADREHSHLPCDAEFFKVVCEHALGVDVDSDDLAADVADGAFSDTLWYSGMAEPQPEPKVDA